MLFLPPLGHKNCCISSSFSTTLPIEDLVVTEHYRSRVGHFIHTDYTSKYVSYCRLCNVCFFCFVFKEILHTSYPGKQILHHLRWVLKPNSKVSNISQRMPCILLFGGRGGKGGGETIIICQSEVLNVFLGYSSHTT